jgi:hypothetical protein
MQEHMNRRFRPAGREGVESRTSSFSVSDIESTLQLLAHVLAQLGSTFSITVDVSNGFPRIVLPFVIQNLRFAHNTSPAEHSD